MTIILIDHNIELIVLFYVWACGDQIKVCRPCYSLNILVVLALFRVRSCGNLSKYMLAARWLKYTKNFNLN